MRLPSGPETLWSQREMSQKYYQKIVSDIPLETKKGRCGSKTCSDDVVSSKQSCEMHGNLLNKTIYNWTNMHYTYR